MFNNGLIVFNKYIADSHDIFQPVWDDYDESCNQKGSLEEKTYTDFWWPTYLL